MESSICGPRTSGYNETFPSSQHLCRKTTNNQASHRNCLDIWISSFSTDVAQAYPQRAENLKRDVFINPPKEITLKPAQLIKLLKPLYGLSESSDYWGRTLKRNLEDERGITSGTSDAALFFKKIGDNLIGAFATYVDDTLHVGNKDYSELVKNTENKFNCKTQEWNDTQFAGIQLQKQGEGFIMNQRKYIEKLQKIPENGTYSDFSH